MPLPMPEPEDPRVERGAEFLYAAYREHRVDVEGAQLAPWADLDEPRRDRFRAQARAGITFDLFCCRSKSA